MGIGLDIILVRLDGVREMGSSRPSVTINADEFSGVGNALEMLLNHSAVVEANGLPEIGRLKWLECVTISTQTFAKMGVVVIKVHARIVTTMVKTRRLKVNFSETGHLWMQPQSFLVRYH